MASKKVKLVLKAAHLAKFANAKVRARVVRKRKRLPDSTVLPRKKPCTKLAAEKLGDDSISITVDNDESQLLHQPEVGLTKRAQIKTEGELAPRAGDQCQESRRAEPNLPLRLIDRSFDPTIEQWYADPYRRINPESKTFEAARFLTIHDGLLNRGYTNKAIRDKLTFHIYSCQGTYKPLTLRRVAQKKTVATDLEQTEPSDNIHRDGGPSIESKVEQPENDEGDAEIDLKLIKSEFEDVEVVSDQEDRKPDIATTTNESIGHSASRTERDPIDKTTMRPFTRKQAIAKIKRSLRLFDMVYGPDGLPPPNYADYYLDYMHSPNSLCPRPMPLKTPLRTQGHKPLKRCTYAGQPAYTEDPTFGITPVPASERTSQADLALYDEAYQRKERTRIVEGMAGIGKLDVGRERPFSDGYTEAWKDIAEKRGMIVPRAEGAKAGIVDVYGDKGQHLRRRRRRRRAHDSDNDGDEEE